MKLTIRHRYHFGSTEGLRELNTAAAWDQLRAMDGIFKLPETRERWEQAAADQDLSSRAEVVVGVARALAAQSLCSYGVGVAYLERRIAAVAPDIAVTCTDFAPRTVARLADLFPEARVVRHDLRSNEPVEAALHLFHRIDTELSDDEWPRIFGRFHQPVLLIATEVLRPRSIVRELATTIRHPHATSAGWIRTEDSLRALWQPTHDDRPLDADLPAYLLVRR